MDDEKKAEDDLQKFITKNRNIIFSVAEMEARNRGYDSKKISSITILAPNSEINVDTECKHFIFSEVINYFGISKKCTVIVYITP
ncbi:MAG: hypothetical protein PHD31_01885 [Candidatus Pacebacteria bacterium]|nr:hypothetical protein [Candidatus Paceibacterota bacterium]